MTVPECISLSAHEEQDLGHTNHSLLLCRMEVESPKSLQVKTQKNSFLSSFQSNYVSKTQTECILLYVELTVPRPRVRQPHASNLPDQSFRDLYLIFHFWVFCFSNIYLFSWACMLFFSSGLAFIQLHRFPVGSCQGQPHSAVCHQAAPLEQLGIAHRYFNNSCRELIYTWPTFSPAVSFSPEVFYWKYTFLSWG